MKFEQIVARLPLILGLFLGCLCFDSGASEVALAWDPPANVDGTTLADLAGYQLHYGASSRSYSTVLNVGKTNTCKVTGLLQGATYYFAVTASGSNGVQSDYSDELVWSVPDTTPPSISVVGSVSLTAGTGDPNLVLCVNSGGGAVGDWTADQGYSPGKTLTTGATIADVPAGVPMQIYQAERYGTPLSYRFSLANGRYTVRLHFAELYWGSAGQRIFNVNIEGSSVLSNFDIVAAAGGKNKALVREFTVDVTDGNLSIDAVAVKDKAKFNGIEVVTAGPPPMVVLPNLVQNATVTDNCSPRANIVVTQSPSAGTLIGVGVANVVLTATDQSGNSAQATVLVSVNYSAPVIVATNLPAPWNSQDIGTGIVPGKESVSNGIFAVFGAGNIGGSADNFHYVYQVLSGNGEIKARVATIQAAATGAKAGIMIRESLTGGSRHATLSLSASGKLEFLRRASTGRSATSTVSNGYVAPDNWIRLVRSGKTITAYKSSNGTKWTSIGSQSITMASTISMGLVTASGTANTLSMATIANVTAVP